MQIKIDLPETFVISTRRGASVTLSTKEIHPDVLPLLFANGVSQKGRDSGSASALLAAIDHFGADKVDKKLTAEQAEWAKGEGSSHVRKFEQQALDEFATEMVAGTWSQRGSGGGGVDEFTSVARQLVRAATKAKLGGTSDAWKAFAALPASEANAKLDANIAANLEAITPAVEEKIAERRKEAEGKRKLAGKLTLSI